MKKALSKQNKGFTLIELSIVLVVIGLLVGGVLVGQDLIEAAKKRQLINQKEQIFTAMNTFKLKYNQMPGDMDQYLAEQLWATEMVACDTHATNFSDTDLSKCGGNNNRIVDRDFEAAYFWRHLTLAGLLYQPMQTDASNLISPYSELPGKVHPQSIKDDVVWYFGHTLTNAYTGHWLRLARINAPSQTNNNNRPDGIRGSFLSGQEMAGLDKKIDDGKPTTGKLRGDLGVSPHWNCYDNSTFEYQATKTDGTVSGACVFDWLYN